MQRIGHTTLVPRHSSPDDRGCTAFIDATNGYAYFVGSYLFKLDITGDLPVQVGPALNTGQATQSAVDLAAGYGYLSKITLSRYALGAGTNAVTSAGSLSLAAGSTTAMILDDSDPNPANHYAYVLCTASGSPARVAKVALGTFTELGSVLLAAGETNALFGSAGDTRNGYGYFVTTQTSGVDVVKIKLTPGANAPVWIGAANLATGTGLIDGGSLDVVHGYGYFGTYDSDTNNPGEIYKVQLGSGGATPTLVGKTSLHAGEGRLSASVVDPVNGYVYFADDNSYPGSVYQLSLNGTNPPVEIRPPAIARRHQQHDAAQRRHHKQHHHQRGRFAALRRSVHSFGGVRLAARVCLPGPGQPRPNQVVKIKLAQLDPFTLVNWSPTLANGAFQFSFSNLPGAQFGVMAATPIPRCR